MISDKIFKITLIISILAHCVFVYALQGHLKIGAKNKVPLEISYIKHEEASGFINQAKPDINIFKPAQSQPKTIQAVIMAGQPAAKHEVRQIRQSIEAINLQANEKNTKNKAGFLDYFQYLKEAIRANAIKRCTDSMSKGSVNLAFTLDSGGVLREINIIDKYSTDEPLLRQAGIDAVKYASPFKGFPGDLDAKQLSFNIIIAFEKGEVR